MAATILLDVYPRAGFLNSMLLSIAATILLDVYPRAYFPELPPAEGLHSTMPYAFR